MMTDSTVSAAAAALGRLGGKSKSPAKAAASRDNGKKGGRPRRATRDVRTAASHGSDIQPS